MKKLFNAICRAHEALRARNPGMPTLRQHVRMFVCVAIMFAAFISAARYPDSQIQFGGMVSGLLAFMTLISIAWSDFKPDDYQNPNGPL